LLKPIVVDAIIPGTKHFEKVITTGKLANNDLAHFFFHNARNNVAETLVAGRERVYIQDFFDRYAFNIGAFPPEVVDVYAKAYAAPGGMRAGFEVYRAFDQDGRDNMEMFAKVGKTNVPLLFIVGQQSSFTSIADDIVAEICQNGSTTAIPNSGHYPAEENPEAFANVVLDFCGWAKSGSKRSEGPSRT
jgi:pimeloyl-ACP methyl ester carboxylesterase